MSLSPAQERVLDAMTEALRATEPRLVSMFAIFTRLTRNEAAPRREQLPGRSLWRSLWRVPLPRIHGGPRGHSRASSTSRRRHRGFWLHVLIASPLALSLLVVGLVFGLGKHGSPPSCTLTPVAHATVVHHPHQTKCPFQPAGMVGR